MIPSLNGIEISVRGATSVLLGVKGLIKYIFISQSSHEQNDGNYTMKAYLFGIIIQIILIKFHQ